MSAFMELAALTDHCVKQFEWLERTRCSVQWNSRIEMWTVQKQEQTCGNIGQDRKIMAAISKAMEVLP